MNRNGRGRCSVGRMAGNGLSSAGGGGEREGRTRRGAEDRETDGERRREAVTIYVKRRGKETDEKNDDGSPHSLLIVRWPHHSLPPPTERESRSGSQSLDDYGAGFIIDEHFIDSSKARRSLDLFAAAKII